MTDDGWEKVSAPPADNGWEKVSAAERPAPDIGEALPEAFVGRLRAGQALGRIVSEAAKGAVEGAGGGTATGFEDDTLNHLIDLGIFHDPAKGRPGPLQMANEAVLMPSAQLWQAITRATAGAIHGAGGVMGQVVEEFGGSQGTANRAKNEVINLGNWAMIEGGMGRFSRPGIEPGGVMDRPVGGLPVPEDFAAAGRVMESPHAEANLRQMWREDGIHPAEAVHDAQTDAFVKNEITAQPTIIAYHGTMHEFGRFDISKVGTGEGAQSFGHGLYFAESEKVGESYQKSVGGENGNLFRVEIKADPNRFLDWDKPLNEQSDFVKQAIGPLIEDRLKSFQKQRGGGPLADPANELSLEAYLQTGALKASEFYHALTEAAGGDYVTGKQAASQSMHERGVPGIKYLDADSRGMGDGTRNYVVFNHDDVQITHKNGIPVETIPKEWDVKPEEMEEAFGKGASLSAALTDPADIPLDVQPPQPPSSLLASAQAAAETLFDVGRDIQMKLAPMARGSMESMATVKDYMNAMRRNAWDVGRIDTETMKRFAPEERARLANAMEEESLSRRLGEPESAREHQGLATLAPEERAFVEAENTRQQLAWLKARDLGMVEGVGIELHYPRMVVGLPKGLDAATEGQLSLNAIGYDLRSKTPFAKQRKHIELEDTEKAIKAKVAHALKEQGKTPEEVAAAVDKVQVVRDIRAVNLATKQLEDAVAGRTLVENIKDVGKRTGDETVAVGFKPDDGWFTVDHPSFKQWRPKFAEVDGKVEAVKDSAGNPVFEQVPIYVRGDFEGPLRSAMWGKSGEAYSAMMSLKGKTMGLIMNSPMIHNLVEFGRAFPAMPTRIVKAYFDGYRAKQDPAVMHEAINAGLVPIGKRFFNQDINAVMESPDLTPGRSLTAKALALVPGWFDEAAGTAVKQAIDKAGDFWHNTLLWDRIADLQAGLYVNFRSDMIAKGMDQTTASRIAAHFANRYAGALPKEAMSEAATKVANFMLFSRSFTLGNLGVMKDMLTGLPKDVLAQIERDAGMRAGSIEGGEAVAQEAAQSAKVIARRKAMMVVGLDIGLMYVGNSVLQSAFNVMLGDNSLSQEGHEYMRRFRDVLNEGAVHPLTLLNPFGVAERLSATADNEPGRKDRVQIGFAKDGTAIYARNPVGKIGEEFSGYFGSPIDMLRKKEGTLMRPMMQILANDAGFGRKVYDPTADSPAKYAGNIWAIVKHLVGSQLPAGQFTAAKDLVMGEGDSTVNALQALGPFAGVTFSKGAPGGPAVGEMYQARTQHEFAVNQALPDIRKQIKRGDIDGAIGAMTELDVPQGLQRYYIKTTLNPALRMSPRAVKDFYLHATDEQKQRFERARSRPTP